MSNNIIARGKRRQSFEKIWEEVTRTECGLNALSKDERRILECFLSLPGRVLWHSWHLIRRAYEKHVSSDTLPDGKMYYNIADRLIPETLDENHQLVARYAADVQEALNKEAKIGLKVERAEFDQDRVDGLVELVSNADQYDDVAERFLSSVENFSQHIVDDIIRRNADFHYRSGLSPKIIRRSERKCCAWCRGLAGVHDYPKVDPDVYRRHENCRCTVLYDPADGSKNLQNVHTRQLTTMEEPAKIKIRKQIKGVDLDRNKKHPADPRTGEPYIYHDISFSKSQFGRKIGKHASDFGLNPGSEDDRKKMTQIIVNIVRNAEERCYGEWAGQESPVLFHILGDDVVIEDKNGAFVTILKGGITSARVKDARTGGI